MSARNYFSAREKNISKYDCLPDINKQKFGYRSVQELPPLSANTHSALVNRNLSYSYDIEPYESSGDRAGTPFSDFFSESDIGTPDFHSEESDSSAGSALRRSTNDATKILADEWDRIERTLYDERGEKSTRPQIIEECKQWRALHPQLRIVGKAIRLPEKKLSCRQAEYDEVIATHYSDCIQFSDSDERLSQSSTDVTPQNSPRVSICEIVCEPKVSWEKISDDSHEPKLTREKVSLFPMYNQELEISDSISSLLHITPIHIRSPAHRKRQNPSILKSDIASSRWMRNTRPDSSVNCDRNSAKSFVSLDTRNYGNIALSASELKMLNSRVLTARHRDLARLEPLCTPDIPQHDICRLSNGVVHPYSIRKVSLPPLLLEEEKKKVTSVSSAKKMCKSRKSVTKSVHQLDRVRHSNNLNTHLSKS